MLQLMDYLILEGAKMQRGYFVFLLQAARAELDKERIQGPSSDRYLLHPVA
jgi:hypothetical protein